MSEVLLETPIFKVERGEETKTGLKPVLVNAPDWVMIVVKKAGQYLVVRQTRFGAGVKITEFPCGQVEPRETAVHAAVRELREETGQILEESQLREIGKMNPNPAFMTNTMHVFSCEVGGVTNWECQWLDEHEDIEWMWVDSEEFEKNAMHPDEHTPAMLIAAVGLLMNERLNEVR